MFVRSRFIQFSPTTITSLSRIRQSTLTSLAFNADSDGTQLDPVGARCLPLSRFDLVSADNVIAHKPFDGNFQRSILPDGVLSSHRFIRRCLRNGDLGSARREFEKIPVKTNFSWNLILSGYSKPGKLKEALLLFHRIAQPDIFSFNILLSCYFQNGDLEAAHLFFDKMPVKDSASWNTMISGFSHNGKMTEALQVFQAMPEKNDVAWSAMISGYIQNGNLDSAVNLFEQAPLSDKGVFSWTAMITGYMTFGHTKLARELFDEAPVRNLVTWNSMVSGYVRNFQGEDALKLFKMMIEFCVRPNPSTFSSVLLACSELSAVTLGKQIHQFIYKSPLYLNTTCGTSLLSMYCKFGVLQDASKMFEEMPRRDVVTWNAMISGFAQHGIGKKAIELFDEMRLVGNKPNWITFVGVLLACNHAGLVKLGMHYFDSMERDYEVVPRPVHYTCMVDLLGRAGLLSEAVELINKMPFKPHTAIFGTLLGACRIHKNLKLAEYAAEKLLELDPRSSAGYVQLANIYAAMNKWNEVARIRQHMKNSNVVKTPGYSRIEVRGIVHEFRSGDRVHSELGLIEKKLIDLEKRMKLAGYVPDLDCALHDVEEERKALILSRHSEKLAIAFGLISMPPGVPILIFKNLRVCGDCHSATKFISLVEKREIIVRDTSRFHHFSNGSCSCGDYW
ncbi:pentatricopeptide repeat-containing protein At4g16835, mitochondrial [Aristolochia californica]|uniref:pentatricopeptide repeat-containing protein At4g16835, mitochondrial n=1 Tax=Aristolochia californica TaxID=171875 RepID=UPI0035D92722